MAAIAHRPLHLPLRSPARLPLHPRPGGVDKFTNRYMVASNRFHMPVDWGNGSSGGFAVGGAMTGINGGLTSTLFRYFFRRWKFTIGTWTAKSGRFLFADAALGVVGVMAGLFGWTIQRLEVRSLANAVVDVVKFGGSGSYAVPAGGRVWSDPVVDLAADTTYYLDVYWTCADLAAFPVSAPAYLSGETGNSSLATNLSLGNPTTAAGTISNAFGGTVGPVTFVAKGAPSDAVCALLTGDSILDGTSVSPYFSPARGDYGHIQQALGDVSGGRINYCSTARYSSSHVTLYQDNISGYGGKNLIDWFADACADLQVLPVFNIWINEHGRNNLSANQTGPAQKGLLRSAATKMRSRYPGMPLAQTTTTPSSTVPTNGAAVLGQAQTPSGTGNSAGGAIQEWNDWIIAGGGGFNPGDPDALPTVIGIDTAVVCRSLADYGQWVVESFSTTLLDAVTALGTRTLRLNDAPAVGDTLVYEAGSANIDGGSRVGVVSSVGPHGSGGYAVTLVGGTRNAMADGTANNGNGAPTKAHAVGAVVQTLTAVDIGGGAGIPLVHATHKYQMLMRDQVILKKANLKTAAIAYSLAA